MPVTMLAITADDCAGRLFASRVAAALPAGRVKWLVVSGGAAEGNAPWPYGNPFFKWMRRLPGEILEGAGRAPLGELLSYRRFRDAEGYLRDGCRREQERLIAPLLRSGPPLPERTDRREASRWICLDYGSLLAAEPRLGRGGAGTILNLHPGRLPVYPGSTGLLEALYRRDLLACGTTFHEVSSEGKVTRVFETTHARLHPRDSAPACAARSLVAGIHAAAALAGRMAAGETLPARDIDPVELHPGRMTWFEADAVLRDFARGWLPGAMATVRERGGRLC